MEIGFYVDDTFGTLHTLVHDSCCNKNTNLPNDINGTVHLANVSSYTIRPSI
jgi:hypothetical protein